MALRTAIRLWEEINEPDPWQVDYAGPTEPVFTRNGLKAFIDKAKAAVEEGTRMKECHFPPSEAEIRSYESRAAVALMRSYAKKFS